MTCHSREIIPIFLRDLKLPTMLRLWEEFADQAVLEGWTPTRYLAALCEHEAIDRKTRRLRRRLQEARLPKGKSLSSFNFSDCPSVDKGQIHALASGDAWIASGANLLLFGPSGVGKTHLAAAIGEGLVHNGLRVLFMRTTELVQQLQSAKTRLELPASLDKLDKYDCLILDDLGYVQKDELETNVLFELICERYERKSLLITCNQPFTEWDAIFHDKGMAVAAVDRLIHHSTVLKIGGESYRRRQALARADKDLSAKEEEKGA